MDVHVPTGPLEDCIEEDEGEKTLEGLKRNQIIAKFNELKANNKIQCAKSLIHENEEITPI